MSLSIHNNMGVSKHITDFGYSSVPMCHQFKTNGKPCSNSCTRMCLDVFTGDIISSCGYHLKKTMKQGHTYEVFSKKTTGTVDYFKLVTAYFGPITYVQWLKTQITNSELNDTIENLRYTVDFMNSDAIEEGNAMNVINKDATYQGTLAFIKTYIRNLDQTVPDYLPHKREWEAYQSYIIETAKRFKLLQQLLSSSEQKLNEYTLQLRSLDKCKLKFIKPAECTICLTDVTDSNEGGTVKRCGHTFHNECLTNWLMNKNSCPNCRCKFIVPMCMM